ncbi:hypothetical protein TNCV_4169591 [Trichonephila clavipes]|nr:hypothetical protein TNCV_4169591 [Trichonephila clavipes]
MKANAIRFFSCVPLGQLVAREPNVCTLFRNPKDHALGCMLNHENILFPLQCCELSLVDQPESILPPVAELNLSELKLDGLFDLHQQFWNGLAKNFSPNCVCVCVYTAVLDKLFCP